MGNFYKPKSKKARLSILGEPFYRFQPKSGACYGSSDQYIFLGNCMARIRL
jgi:hypothetical protein